MPPIVLTLVLTADPPDPLPDRLRFPHADTVSYAIRFNHAYHAHCQAMLWFQPNNRDAWRRRAALSRELLRVWEEPAVAQDDDGEAGDDNPERTRAAALARLRALLGEEDYAAGRTPPCVPIWLYTLNR